MTEDAIQKEFSIMFHKNNCTVIQILDATEDSITAQELIENLNKLRLFSRFKFDRETAEYVRLPFSTG